MQTSDFKTTNNWKLESKEHFEALFKSYYPILCHYAIQYVKTNEQAEEIVQELFYQLWKQRKQLEIHSSIKAYLYKSTYLNCMDWIRKNKVRSAYQNIKMNSSTNAFMDTAVEQKEIHQIIQDTLTEMPQRVREIFKLSRFEGLKYHEIAAKLSISVKTVEANMGRALKLFRTNLKDYAGLLLL